MKFTIRMIAAMILTLIRRARRRANQDETDSALTLRRPCERRRDQS